jgi:hypothetical protein
MLRVGAPSPQLGWTEDGFEVAGGVLVLGGDLGPVDVEGGGSSCVAEPVCDGSDVDAGGEQFGRDEMAEIVHAYMAEVEAFSVSAPACGHDARVPGPGAGRLVGEDLLVRLRRERLASLPRVRSVRAAPRWLVP